MQPYRLTKHRGKWAVTTGSGSSVRRVSTGTADRELADKRARHIWLAMQGSPSERVSDLWQIYLADREADGKSTINQRQVWKNLAPSFGDKLGSELGRDQCRAYATIRKREGASASTIATELAYLRACLNLRYGRGNTKLWVPSASPPRDQYLTKDQARALIDAAETPHLKLFIILALSTGARMSALLELTWDRVDFRHRLINLNPLAREQTTKRRPEVPMNDMAYQALTAAARGALSDYVIEYAGKPIKSIKKAMRRLSLRVGIDCSPHVLRHTAGVWMANADLPMEKISQFLGHTSIRVTESVYARYSPSYMKDAAQALSL